MIDEKTTIDIRNLKPKMIELPSIDNLTPAQKSDTIIMAKADGEFSIIYYNAGNGAYSTRIVNAWKRLRADYPALVDLEAKIVSRNVETFRDRYGGVVEGFIGLKTMKICAEPYVRESGGEGKVGNLPQYIRAIKSHNEADHKRVKLGVWDIMEINGTDLRSIWSYEKRLQLCVDLFGTMLNESVHVLPSETTNDRKGLKGFYDYWVGERGYEGVVVNMDGQMYKIKPIRTLEAAIIGINRKEKLETLHEVTSVRLAVMDESGDFIELGDMGTATDQDVSKTLYKLMELKLEQRNSNIIYVKPVVVVELAYTSTFTEVEGGVPVMQRKLRFETQPHGGLGEFRTLGTVPFVSLKSPRLKNFRLDKKVRYEDIPAEQIWEAVNMEPNHRVKGVVKQVVENNE